MKQQELREHVERGCALLDEYFNNPYWDMEVDISMLDIGTLTLCVLGQAFPSYGLGNSELHAYCEGYGRDYDDVDYGFDLDNTGTGEDRQVLNNFWKEAIITRREARGATC